MLRSVRSGVLDTSADWLVLEGWEFLGGLMEWVNANYAQVDDVLLVLEHPEEVTGSKDEVKAPSSEFRVKRLAHLLANSGMPMAAAADAKAHDHAIPPSGEFSEGEADGTAEDDGGGVGSVQDNEWETPEVDDPAFVLSESDKGRIKSENDKWRVIAEGCTEVAHEVIDIPMVEILPTKSAKAIVSALNKFYARLRSWGLPVYRMHSDRARELTDPLVTQWAAHRGIYKTTTAPEQPAGNGRAEQLVRGEEFGAEEQVQEHALKPEARIILEGRRLASISAMREQEQALVKELQSGHVELAQSTAELLEQMDNSVSCLESLLESLSGQAVSEWESEGLLRSDVHLRALDAEADVLQTKMVPIAEVAKDIDSWKPSLSDELASVTTVHKAGVIISEEEARLLESNPDVEVLRVPGKIVASIKPPFKRKARFVACGNYLTRQKESKSPTLDRHDLYSAGLDSFALRTQLAIGAYKSWKCASLDVKTAFLTAPLQQPRATGKTRKERIVLVRVPRVMVLAGLVPPGSWMRVEGALYGLQESPHSWGSFRDGKLQCLTWCTPSGEKVGLEQCAADVSVWLIKSGGLVVGTLGVYVDDLLVMTQSEHLMPTLDAIRSLWKCSDPEYASKQGGFRFCGLQIEERSGMIWIHQRDYLVDLFSKYPHLKSSSVLPQFKEEPPAETPTASTVQYAQRIIGELTWVIRYLMFTVDYCLCYGPSLVVPEDFLAELPSVRNDAVLETWADASFAAQEDGDSQTGVIVTLVGMPVAWLSLRQPCVALSTCEAEVVSCIEGVCLTRALRPLIEEMLGQVVTWHLLNDSVSCSAVLAFPGIVLPGGCKCSETSLMKCCVKLRQMSFRFLTTERFGATMTTVKTTAIYRSLVQQRLTEIQEVD
ncbi:Retrovirus-related Pol polyprotein from transposon TNT 1-94 [Symbiodinium microadriaticum]|uniref:Retrovirus-related Pol polyprotein from transposon TNT 1-94 n=1 Tax=Symbiodinium microadriaticum TaxID=2951 RepID=A0A1Q9EZM6_SYMMI|nr:Retrovirus-related Pol polyprotein from transposon TNT 1-94 [Symbiodinium microadriaticum]